MNSANPIATEDYQDIESKIRETLKKTIGHISIRTDKPHKPKTEANKEARKERKIKKRKFEEACKSNDEATKLATKQEYQAAQKHLRGELEKHEIEMIEKRIEEITAKAKIDPNDMASTKKKSKQESTRI